MPSFGFLLSPHEAHTSSLSPPVLLQVQLQLLTAIVKLFLKKPTETQELVQQVLSLATQVSAPASPLCSTQLLLYKGRFGPDPDGPAPKTVPIVSLSPSNPEYFFKELRNKSRWNGVKLRQTINERGEGSL